MKKAFLTLGLAVAALTLTNCNKQENDVPGLDGIQARISLITEETKTVNDGMNTKWKSGDALSVWVADAAAPAVDYGANLKFDVDAESGTATGVVEELPASSNWYAVYPYDSHLVNPTANDGEKRSGYITVGSRANAAQTQNGNDSKAHLAGSSMPLYGVASNVTGTPSIVMKQVCGVIAVNVTNATNEPITVQSVKFTADNYIVGTYYMDFSSGEADLAPSGDNFVADWVELSVNGASPIAAGESAKFYIAVKPFSGNIVSIGILSDKGESYKEAGNNLVPIEVSAGQIKTVNYTFESAVEVPAKEYPYEESFAASQGDFTIDNVAKPDGLNFVWAWNSSKYMKASGFYSNTNYETESWLISPVVDLATAKEPAVYFSQCINKYFFDVAAEATLWIREEGGNWNQIQIGHPELPESGNWSKMTDYVYPVGEFAGKKVQVGFKYVSTSNGAGTWEVKNFKLAEYEETPTVTLASIEVSNAKTSYTVGDEFVKPTVTAYYSDQSSKDVTASATFSGYELTKAGSYTVEVSYTEGGVTKTTSYGITVSAGGSQGEGDLHTIIMADYASVSFTAGAYTVTAEKGEGSTNPAYNTGAADLRVYAKGLITISNSKENITKIVFNLSAQGLKRLAPVTASTGTIATQASGDNTVTWTGNASSVTFTVGEKADFGSDGDTKAGQLCFTSIDVAPWSDGDVQAKTLESISVSGQKASFNVGDAFAFGGTVTANYSDGSHKNVTEEADFSSPDMNSAGEKTVTVSYTESGVTKTCDYTITVSAVNDNAFVFDFTITGDARAEYGLDAWDSAENHDESTRDYLLNNTNYSFILGPYTFLNTGYLFLKAKGGDAYLGLPAISGKKLVQVVITAPGAASASAKATISSDADGQQIVTGGEVQTLTKGGKTTFDLSGTSANTVYYIKASDSGYNDQISKLELVYE